MAARLTIAAPTGDPTRAVLEPYSKHILRTHGQCGYKTEQLVAILVSEELYDAQENKSWVRSRSPHGDGAAESLGMG